MIYLHISVANAQVEERFWDFWAYAGVLRYIPRNPISTDLYQPYDGDYAETKKKYEKYESYDIRKLPEEIQPFILESMREFYITKTKKAAHKMYVEASTTYNSNQLVQIAIRNAIQRKITPTYGTNYLEQAQIAMSKQDLSLDEFVDYLIDIDRQVQIVALNFWDNVQTILDNIVTFDLDQITDFDIKEEIRPLLGILNNYQEFLVDLSDME